MAGSQKFQELKASSPKAAGMTDAQFAISVYDNHYRPHGWSLDDFLTQRAGLDPAAVRQELSADPIYAGFIAKQDTAEEAKKTSLEPTGNENIGDLEGIGRSVWQGASFGFGDELAGATNALIGDIGSPDYWAKMGQRYAEAQAEEQRKLKSYEKKEPGIAAVAEFGGSLVPSILAMPFTGGASVAPSIGRAATVAGLQGLAYGYGKAEDPNDPGALISAERFQEAIPGALLSSVVGAGGAKLGQVLSKPTVARTAEEQVAEQVAQNASRVLDNYGIPTTAGQRTGNIGVQELEQRGGKNITELLKTQPKAFSEAVWEDIVKLRELDDAGAIPPDFAFTNFGNKTIKKADQVFKNAYDALENQSMLFDAPLLSRVSNVARTYSLPTNIAPGVPNESNQFILKTINALQNLSATGSGFGGSLTASGKMYNDIYKRLGKIIATDADFDTREAARELQTAITAAMKRGIAALNPKDVAAKEIARLDKLRGSYQNFLAIETAAKNKVNDLYIDPNALRSVVANMDPDATVRGTGNLSALYELSDAAAIAAGPLKEKSRNLAQELGRRYGPSGVSGALVGTLTAPMGPLVAVPASSAAAFLGALGQRGVSEGVGRLAGSRLGQKYLANELPKEAQYLGRLAGLGIDAAAPITGQGMSETLGLGSYLQGLGD